MSLARNINKIKTIVALRHYSVLLPFFLIYAHYYGLNYTQIFVTQIVFSLSVVIFEIPGGLFSDQYGRKLSLLLASIFWLIGSFFLFSWRCFLGFCFAEFLLAVGFALFSGSDTALLYETMQELKQPEEYLRHEGSMQAYSRYAEGFSALTGGLLAQLSLFILALVNFVVQIPGVFISSGLQEVDGLSRQVNFKSMVKVKFAQQLGLVKVNLFSRDKDAIRLILLYSALLSSITISSFWLLQVFATSHHLSYISVGFIWLVYHGLSGVLSQNSKFILNHFSIRGVLWLLPLLLQVMSLGLTLVASNWALLFILLAAITFGIKMPFAYYLLNTQLDSAVRASTLSLDSMLSRILFSLMGLFIGVILDHGTLQEVFLMMTIPNVLIFYLAYQLSRVTDTMKI